MRDHCHVPYEERRRLRADLILAFTIFVGEINLNLPEVFLRPTRAGLWGHTYRLLQGLSRHRRRSGVFCIWIVKFWNRLPAHLVLAPSVSIFNTFKGEVNLNPCEFFLRPPRAGLRGHNCPFLQGPSRLRRRSGAFSFRIMKFWNRLLAHLVSSPSTSVPIHWQFSQYCYSRLFMFSLNPQSRSRLCCYYWPSWKFLPIINKFKIIM